MKRSNTTVWKASSLSIGVLALAALAAQGTLTEAQRADHEFAQATFQAAPTGMFNLEGSTDANTYATGIDAQLQLAFPTSKLSMAVGAQHAIYAPIYLRAGAGSNLTATVSLTENALISSPMAAAMRANIYQANTCDGEGVQAGTKLNAATEMMGQSITGIHIPAPTEQSQAGQPVALCVEAWLDNNDWLLAGTQPPTITAGWLAEVTETAPAQENAS